MINMNYLKTAPINHALSEGLAEPIEYLSSKFERFYENLILKKSGGIEWDSYAAVETVDWNDLEDDVLVKWARNLTIGQHDYVVLWLNSTTPCLVMPFDWGVANFDYMVRHAPGQRYLFGADKKRNSWDVSFENILEYDGISHLTGVTSELIRK